jgi:polyketide biosynthesis acyl carrier protein
MTAASDTALEEMAALVRSVVAEILPALPPERITEDRHPRDLGADSVDRVEIILTLLDRLGLREPMARFGELPDLGALAALLVTLTLGED